MRKTLKAVLIALAAVLILAAAGVGFLSLTEFRPGDIEPVELSGGSGRVLRRGESVTAVSWNTGYGALGANADFFMDGGKMVNTASRERVMENLEAMRDFLDSAAPDIIFLQETDFSSARSHGINQLEFFRAGREEYISACARNFKCAFVPFPLPPIGRVDSGIVSFSAFPVGSAERVQLPVPFSWPVSTANFKRCLLVMRLPVEGGGELVLVNLHLEAYDDGEGKTRQTEMLVSLLNAERQKGNYVIAGGDFNQTFSFLECAPVPEGLWSPGVMDVSSFGKGWQFLTDGPTCRSLDRPYEGDGEHQLYIIDGFILSDNIEPVSFGVSRLGFEHSDHEPVSVTFRLK